MIINIKNKEVELKYTYNSFKYMADLDFGSLEDIERKPLMILSFLETMVMGAVNNSPKIKFSEEDVQEFLEGYIIENHVEVLLQELMSKLQESSFFKSLQKR